MLFASVNLEVIRCSRRGPDLDDGRDGYGQGGLAVVGVRQPLLLAGVRRVPGGSALLTGHRFITLVTEYR